MPNIGIVGHESLKFLPAQVDAAKAIIREILTPVDAVVVSGHCHLGGVDIWAEEIAIEMGRYRPELIYAPKSMSWEGGYKERNMQIAYSSHEIHVIVVKDYPPDYKGMRHDHCYHCYTTDHIKSGACWTAKQGKRLGIPVTWHVV